jgi:D-alanyl-D-alanine carboxypeptidase
MRIITGNRFKNNAEIASLTKIMTFYTIYRIAQERRIDLAAEMTIVDD